MPESERWSSSAFCLHHSMVNDLMGGGPKTGREQSHDKIGDKRNLGAQRTGLFLIHLILMGSNWSPEIPVLIPPKGGTFDGLTIFQWAYTASISPCYGLSLQHKPLGLYPNHSSVLPKVTWPVREGAMVGIYWKDFESFTELTESWRGKLDAELRHFRQQKTSQVLATSVILGTLSMSVADFSILLLLLWVISVLEAYSSSKSWAGLHHWLIAGPMSVPQLPAMGRSQDPISCQDPEKGDSPQIGREF
jgi:hypothetical protein